MSLLIDHPGIGFRRVRCLLCLLLSIAVLAATIPLVLSPVIVCAESTVDELNAQKAALAAEQDALAAQRDETAATLEEQQQQNDIIRQQINAKSDEIAINEQLLTELDAAIADKTARIAEQEATVASLETQITEQREKLRVRLRGISQKGSITTIVQLILSSSTYADYLIGFKASECISAQSEQLMQQLEQNIRIVEAAKNQAKTDKAALEIERTQAALIQQELEAGKAGLQTLYAEANALTDRMAQNVEYLDEQIAAIDAQQASLQTTIDAVMEQIRAEEEARRQAEEEERRRQEEEEQRRQEEEVSDEVEDDDSDGTYDEGSSEGDSSSQPEDDPDDVPENDNFVDDDPEEDEDGTEPDASIGDMLWPAPTCSVITSSFKYREQFGRWHNGLDIARYGDAEGEPIVAVAPGTVRYANRYDTWGGGYGLFMMIDHGYDSEGRRIITLYAHCSEVLAYEGLEVEAGDLIGYIGNTGNSYGAHLHFEVQVDGTAVDPVSNGYISTEWVDVLG